MKKTLKKVIKKTALYVTEHSVGKSFPITLYEVKIPEELKNKEGVK